MTVASYLAPIRIAGAGEQPLEVQRLRFRARLGAQLLQPGFINVGRDDAHAVSASARRSLVTSVQNFPSLAEPMIKGVIGSDCSGLQLARTSRCPRNSGSLINAGWSDPR